VVTFRAFEEDFSDGGFSERIACRVLLHKQNINSFLEDQK